MAVAVAPTRARLWRRFALAGIGISVVAPVWVAPVLVTQDGPSHLYNAMVAAAADAGRAPFAATFQVDHNPLRPNQASEFLLGQLGRVLGWEPAERAVLSLAMLVNFIALMWLVGGTRGLVLAPAVAWLAHSWFAWMGFDDFVLSLAGYAALIGVLAHPLLWRRPAVLWGVLASLYLTHFFTFALGSGLAFAVVAWRVRRRQASWPDLGALTPAALVLLVELLRGSATGGAALTWQAPWQPLLGLAVGDVVRSFHPFDAVGGVAIMAAVWATVGMRIRGIGRGGSDPVGAFELWGVGLLVLSVVAPSLVGEGGYVPIRLQMLGVVTLLPSVAAARRHVPPPPARGLAGVIFLGFLAHALYVVQVGVRVNRDLLRIDDLLARSGAGAGAWVRTRFADSRRGLFRIAGYRHLVERIATRRMLVALDDYEARYGVFAVSWRGRPDWLTIVRPREDSLELGLVPGALGWGPGLYLVHEQGWRLGSRDARLDVSATVSAGGFAVTRVRRRR